MRLLVLSRQLNCWDDWGFDYRKNIPRLLQAFKLLGDVGQHLQIVLVGRLYGPYVASVRSRVQELGLSKRVVFPGNLSPDEIRSLYRAATLFVYPSLYEGFGLPILEAMASGVPTVSSDRSSLPEVAGDAALLVDPENPEAIAHAMRRLIEDNELRQEMSRRGRERALSFSWQKTAEQTWRVYQGLVGV